MKILIDSHKWIRQGQLEVDGSRLGPLNKWVKIRSSGLWVIKVICSYMPRPDYRVSRVIRVKFRTGSPTSRSGQDQWFCQTTLWRVSYPPNSRVHPPTLRFLRLKIDRNRANFTYTITILTLHPPTQTENPSRIPGLNLGLPKVAWFQLWFSQCNVWHIDSEMKMYIFYQRFCAKEENCLKYMVVLYYLLT